MKNLLLTVAAVFAFAAPASAQTYGAVSLAPGFEPDPVTVQLEAGGPLAASQAHASCTGYVADAADFAVTWAGGSTLTFMAVSDADTTLLVLAPGERVVCDDDSAGDGDPAIVFTNASPGLYQVWVGTFASGALAPATLAVTERVAGQ